MPKIYKVKDPESGVTLNLSGDSPPTEAELIDVFKQYNKQQDLGDTVVDWARRVVNPAIGPYATAAAAGAAAGAPIGGVGALPGAAAGVGALALTDIGSSLYNAVSGAFGGPQVPSGSEAIRQMYGPNIMAPATTPTQRVARAGLEFAAGGQGAISAANRLAEAGVAGPTTTNVLRTMTERPGAQAVAAGAAGTATQTAREMGVENPYVLTAISLAGGLTPAALGATGRAVGRIGYNLAEPFLPGGTEAIKARAYVNAFGGDPMKLQAAIDLLGQGKTPQEVAVQLGSSGFAALVGSAPNANTIVKDMYLARDALAAQANANKLAAATTNINRMRDTIDTAETQAVKQRQAEQAAAEARALAERQRLAGEVKGTSQREVGRTITAQRAAAVDTAKKEIVTPAYEAAFDAAPGRFSFAPVEAAATELAASDATKLNPSHAPYTTEALRMYASEIPEDTGGIIGVSGERLTPPPGAQPKMVDLRQADTFVKALNMDLAALANSTDAAANVTRANLMKLKTAAENAIAEGTKGTNAADLYQRARDLHLSQVVVPFRQGWVANLARTGATGAQQLTPDNVVRTILANEDNAIRFVSALGDDPVAMSATRAGIEEAFRRQTINNGVIDPTRVQTFFTKYEPAINALDQHGMNIGDRLRGFAERGTAAKAAQKETKAAGEGLESRVKEQFKTQRATVEELNTQAEKAQRQLGDRTPDESAKRLAQVSQSQPQVKQLLDEVTADLANKDRFDELVREGIRAGGGVKGLVSESTGKAPFALSHTAALANFLMARAKGALDAKLAAQVAAEMYNSNGAAKALADALIAGQSSSIRRMLNKPSAGVPRAGVVNALRGAQQNQNALAQ
jgi:hypothetical protein